MFDKNNENVSVIGAGSWGTAIASMVARAISDCTLYSIESQVTEEINSKHTNSKYLAKTLLPKGVKATSNLQDIIDSYVIIIAVPSFAFIDIINQLKTLKLSKDSYILLATKGMCEQPLQLFSDYIEYSIDNSYGFITGPNFALEVAQGKLSAITISSKNITLAQNISLLLSNNKLLKIGISSDVITVQIASMVKNIVAIRSGMMDAAGEGQNAKAWLVSQALVEIKTIALHFGGKEESLILPSVVGDLVLTSYSQTSRNTKFGFDFYNNSYSKEYLKHYPVLVEGIMSTKLITRYVDQYNFELPIISYVADKLL